MDVETSGVRVVDGFELDQSYPNPFNQETIISFYSDKLRHIELSIYDVQGNLVTVLFAGACRGKHEVRWSGLDFSGKAVASGLYFYKLSTPDGTLGKKMMIIR